IGFSKVTRDLTERRFNEESLRQSEERFRALVEQVIDYGIFLMDEKGRIVSWNEGARRIKGYEAREIIGKYFSIFYLEEDIILGKPAHELKVARQEGKYEEEGWRIRKDGSRFWSSVLITAVYNTDGALIGFSKVTRDLTERKESERALRDAYERYRALAEELRVTNHELMYANGELEQFTSIVSHDLQEPIRTIKSFLQLIEAKLPEAATEDLRQYINKSIGAADRMRELIRNLQVRFSVTDDGIGIADGDLNKVFEIFRRLNTEKKYPGTGIGLAICKKIVDRHNGRIWPESEPGKGTTFHFTINQENTEKALA
ncbi:MAG: PAS domain-containing sensor histidine kinase, partial [Chitinophagaceae bacterium]